MIMTIYVEALYGEDIKKRKKLDIDSIVVEDIGGIYTIYSKMVMLSMVNAYGQIY